jgi:hypothetical protein
LEHELKGVLVPLEERTGPPASLGEINFTSDQYQNEFTICTVLSNAHVNWEAPDPAQVQLKRKIAEGEIISTNLAAEPTRIDFQWQQAKIAQEQWFYAHKILALKKDAGALDTDTFQDTSHRILANLWLIHCKRNAQERAQEIQGGSTTAIALATSYAGMQTSQRLHSQYLGQSSGRRGGRGKNRPGQDDFSNNLKRFYDCFEQRNGTNHIWCPVMGVWFPREETKAAHIVPWSFGEANAKTVFPVIGGEGGYLPGKILMDERNGLYLHKDIEKEMDDGKLVILPYSYGDRTRFKAHILDEKLRGETFGLNGEYSWINIHERELQFKNENRPARRFLYFRMLLTVLQRCIYQPQGWAYNLQSLIEGPIWATAGEYLDRSVIQDIMCLIGDPHVQGQLIQNIPARDSELSNEGEDSIAECSASLAGLVANQIFSV